MEMIASKIKIRKVKAWAIYFDYEGKKFLLHESSDCYERSTTLYERLLENGRYKLKPINSYYGNIITLNYFSSKAGRTYSQVDTKKFLRKLVYEELVQNKKVSNELKKIEQEIEKYKQIEDFCRRKRIELEYESFK